MTFAPDVTTVRGAVTALSTAAPTTLTFAANCPVFVRSHTNPKPALTTGSPIRAVSGSTRTSSATLVLPGFMWRRPRVPGLTSLSTPAAAFSTRVDRVVVRRRDWPFGMRSVIDVASTVVTTPMIWTPAAAFCLAASVFFCSALERAWW
jgi:hypothetical protein